VTSPAKDAAWQAVPAVEPQPVQAEANDGTIPYAFRVGVTGHRRLPDDPALTAQIDHALDRILELAPRAQSTPTRLTIISPLAEGADRLVAGRVLQRMGAELEVPLPLSEDDYLSDFSTDTSKEEFHDFLDRADVVNELPHCDSRDEAYEQVGRYIVERSDVLIALWDGLPPRGLGGTARIVAFARQRKLPVLWIKTEPPYPLTEDLGEGLPTEGLEKLDEYNRLHLEPALERHEVERRRAQVIPAMESLGLPAADAESFASWNLPFLSRANALAERYKRRFTWLGYGIFYLAATATATGAAVSIFAPNHPRLALLEVAILILILGLLLAAKRTHLHEHWIFYRFLAEHFRSQLYLALAGVSEEAVLRQETGHDWLDRATEQVWRQRPRITLAPDTVERLRDFLANDWIGGQVRYQTKTHAALHRRRNLLSYLTLALFVCTLIAAVAHALGWVEGISDGAQTVVFLAIALPAVAAAVEGVTTQREYERNAVRARQMVPRLEHLERLMREAPDISHIRRVAREAASVMLSENRDWFVVMEFRDIELHV